MMRQALTACRDQFALYVKEHCDKAERAVKSGDFDTASASFAKAATNQRFVDLANESLSQAERRPPTNVSKP